MNSWLLTQRCKIGAVYNSNWLTGDAGFFADRVSPGLAFYLKVGHWPPRGEPQADRGSELAQKQCPGHAFGRRSDRGSDTGEIFIENGRFHGKQIVKAFEWVSIVEATEVVSLPEFRAFARLLNYGVDYPRSQRDVWFARKGL